MIRRSPRHWWFYFWLISVPIIVFLTFVEPFVIEPMFFTFAPLSKKTLRSSRSSNESWRAQALRFRPTACSG